MELTSKITLRFVTNTDMLSWIIRAAELGFWATSNYLDPTGTSGGCFSHSNPLSTIGTETFTGNINMVSGNAVTGTGACP